MNIVVVSPSKKVFIRPDITWERDNEDVYLPEFVDRVSFTPVLFARVSKPGRSVSAKFASRYYDGIGYGVFLYPENLLDGSEEAFACASCVDHTSFLPFPLYNPITLGVEGNEFILKKDDEQIFFFDKGTKSMIEEAIEEATKFCYIRIGDIIAIELQPRQPLLSGKGSAISLNGTYCENSIIDFKVIL